MASRPTTQLSLLLKTTMSTFMTKAQFGQFYLIGHNVDLDNWRDSIKLICIIQVIMWIKVFDKVHLGLCWDELYQRSTLDLLPNVDSSQARVVMEEAMKVFMEWINQFERWNDYFIELVFIGTLWWSIVFSTIKVVKIAYGRGISNLRLLLCFIISSKYDLFMVRGMNSLPKFIPHY